MTIRRFEASDAQRVSELIQTTLRISNAGDYPREIDGLIELHTPEYITKRADWTHFYVAEDNGDIVGCGAIGPYWDRTDESSLFTLFVRPERQGRGIGRSVVEALERDEFFLRARRVEVPASLTALPFYLKMGYRYKDGNREPDAERLVRLEKYRDI